MWGNVMPVRYWTTEQKGPWRVIEDTPEAEDQVISNGGMFITWNSLSKPWQHSGAPEPNRSGHFVIDTDDAADPAHALQDLKDLCLVHLPELYGVDPYDIKLFLSGGKGGHGEIPAESFGAEAGDPYQPKIYKKIASEFKTSFKLETLDLSLYNMKRGKMWRLPNVKRSNGRYKVPISLEELRDLSTDELLKLTESPREIDIIDDDPPETCPDLKMLYDEAKAFVYQEQKDRIEADPLTDEEKARISKEIPPCVRYVLTACPTTEKTNFNKLVLNLCKYFITAGHDLKSSIDAVWPFLEKYQHSATYTTKEARLQHWREMFTYLSGDADSDFNCSYMRGMSFPGSAFECKTCLARVTPEDFENLDAPAEPFSAAALKLAKEIENAIANALGIAPEDEEERASLRVNTAVIDRMINGAFWSGQKSKLFLLNHSDSLNQYLGAEAYMFLAKTFGRAINTARVQALATAMEFEGTKTEKKKFVKGVCNIHVSHIMNYLKYFNQRDAVEWRVSMFSKQSRMELKEDTVRLVLPHKPFVRQGKRDDAAQRQLYLPISDNYTYPFNLHFAPLDHDSANYVESKF